MSEPTSLEESPFFKRAVLPRPETLATWPKVSLFVMAKNAESCIGRLLSNLIAPDGRPYISELALLLNDTEDATARIASDFCKQHQIDSVFDTVTREQNPGLYLLDTKATYETGRSLVGEVYEGPFTESPMLANWSAARNTLWDSCNGAWRLFLDADDVIKDPESLPGLVNLLESEGVEQAATRYIFELDSLGRPLGSSYRERLVKNVPHITWAYPVHEVLVGAARTAHVDGNLTVVDMRDNRGAGIRVPGRNFKVLYHLARNSNWEVSPRTLVNLIMEARHLIGTDALSGASMEFVEKLLALYLERSVWPEERGWAIAMVGEMRERSEDWTRASLLYLKSLDEHPGAKTAFRLCRTRFMMQDYRGAVEAFDLGCANKTVHQVLDDGALYEDMTKILVASALDELGERERAKQVCAEALTAFPGVMALRDLASKLGVL